MIEGENNKTMLITETPVNNVQNVKCKESYSEKLGRYLIAAKNLAPGEVIFRDKPVAVGAASFNDNPLCFACFRVIPKEISLSSKYACNKCAVAVFCCATCEEKKLHHTAEECEIFQNKSLTASSTLELSSILLPFRLLLIRQSNDKLWQEILRLEAHVEARRNTPVWKNRQEHTINVLKTFGLINESKDENIDELMQQLCGILDVNSFELRSPGTIDTSALRGLYLQAALMAHDCRGNTHLAVDDEFQLTIYASKAIDEGEIIFFNYTSSLLATAERREHLREGKYFVCECDLCQDPDELGANLSTIFCPRCRTGFLQFKGAPNVTPYVKDKNWECKKCQRTFSGRLIKRSLDLAQSRINETDDLNIKSHETLIKELSTSFHPNHFLMLMLKQKLLTAYRNDVVCLNPGKKMLTRMIELCKEILQVLEIVEPGISRLKGIILYEIHLPMVIQANQNYTAQEITLEELLKQLEEAECYLKKSLTMLLLEPATTPEGVLAKRALQEYKRLRENLEDVRLLMSVELDKKKIFPIKNVRKLSK